MYIGAWQEYKLARLIQNQHQQLQRGPSRREDCADDAASAAGSSRSGFSGISTQSAPAKVSQASVQSLLNNACSARPRSSSGSARQATKPQRSTAARPPPTKPPRKPRAKGDFEQERRDRIKHLQKLYGLAAHSASDALEAESGEQRLTSNDVKDLTSRPRALADRVQKLNGGSPPILSAADAALRHLLQTESQGVAADHLKSGSGSGNSSGQRVVSRGPAASQQDEWGLSSVAEDPLNLSMSMGSSAGLIAWSKNLKPDELSPRATLAGFFSAPAD